MERNGDGDTIGLYTPINYSGRYATCSHKDGGRSIFSLEKQVTCLKLGPRDMFKTRSARKFKSCVFEPPTRRVFSINTSSSNTLFLFWPNFFAAATHSLQRESTVEKSNTMNGPRRHSYTRTMRRFLVSEKLPVSNHKKGHFKLAILFVA